MSSHPVNPLYLAIVLDDDTEPEDYLQDMHEHPDLYYPDHVDACLEQNILPLSRRQWRFACWSRPASA